MKNKKLIFDLLRGAIKRETDAFNYYQKASLKSPFPETKSLLLQLASEERKHRIILMQELQTLIELGKDKDGEKYFIREEEISYQIPSKLTFRKLQKIPFVDLACVSLPTEFVGGDYLESFIIPASKSRQNSLGIILYDIMGHGMDATNLKALTRETFDRFKEPHLERETSYDILRPKNVATTLNHKLWEECKNRATFLTLFYCVIDPQKKNLSFVSAGHEPPILVSNNGKEVQQLMDTELMIGVDKNKTYSERQVELKSKDILIIFTDGVMEAFNSREEAFGRERLTQVAKENHHSSAQELITKITYSLRDFLQGEPMKDEFTLAVLKIK